MILQALYDYYQRKASDPESGIAPEGFEWKEIPFLIVIDKDGKFVAIDDLREGEGKKKRAKAILVPSGEKKTVGIKSNLLWDSVEYVLGANPRVRDDIEARHNAFKNKLWTSFPEFDIHPQLQALHAFLESNPVQQIEAFEPKLTSWQEILDTNANVTFRVDGEEGSICDAVRPLLQNSKQDSSLGNFCLVSGLYGITSRIHPSIKGVKDAQSSGAALISYNLASFTSFGKVQNFNAPISESSTFAYTTALNWLLGRASKNKIQIGDATTIFWSDRQSHFVDDFASFFAFPPKDDPDRDARAVHALYRSIDAGILRAEPTTRFFVLGLSPNAARISVRFWQIGTIAEISTKIAQHFKDLEIVRGPNDQDRYSLFWHLVDIAMEHKADNIPPNLAGNVTRAILEGLPYPAILIHQTVRRIRAERSVSRMRASLLKAYLNRCKRFHKNQEQEITVSLDLTNNCPGYRLGRLFAELEKIQEDAQPGINATIRDRFYGAASASPVSVFPQLLKLKNHHLAKLENPAFRVNHEKRLAEIIGGLAPDMPSHLSMDEQARFAIGYYHQRQAFFTKIEKDSASETLTEIKN